MQWVPQSTKSISSFADPAFGTVFKYIGSQISAILSQPQYLNHHCVISKCFFLPVMSFVMLAVNRGWFSNNVWSGLKNVIKAVLPNQCWKGAFNDREPSTFVDALMAYVSRHFQAPVLNRSIVPDRQKFMPLSIVSICKKCPNKQITVKHILTAWSVTDYVSYHWESLLRSHSAYSRKNTFFIE